MPILSAKNATAGAFRILISVLLERLSNMGERYIYWLWLSTTWFICRGHTRVGNAILWNLPALHPTRVIGTSGQKYRISGINTRWTFSNEDRLPMSNNSRNALVPRQCVGRTVKYRSCRQEDIDGLLQGKRNSSVLAMELRLSSTNTSKWPFGIMGFNHITVVSQIIGFSAVYSRSLINLITKKTSKLHITDPLWGKLRLFPSPRANNLYISLFAHNLQIKYGTVKHIERNNISLRVNKKIKKHMLSQWIQINLNE